jgi:hypothetical protein
MLLEVVYKVVGNILKERIMVVSESLDHEQQCGFRPARGCMDAVFNLKTALRKRREHGMETWVLLLDLVKAFDRVPRELLWSIMERFGFPEKIVSLLRALHAKVLVNFEVEGVRKVIESIIGVKQGDLLGPILFNIYACAVMIAWRKIRAGMHERGEVAPCMFRTKQDFVLGTATAFNRRKWSKGGESGNLKEGVEEFEVSDSEYADDTAALFCSREDCEKGIPPLIDLFSQFGGEVHVKQPGQTKPSKTVVVFVAKKRSEYVKGDKSYGGANLADIDVGGGGTVGIVQNAKYLGCLIDRDGNDKCDVIARVEKASQAFGAVSSCVFKSGIITMRVKAAVYAAVVLSVLLYGCEAWALTEALLTRLRSFHRRCVREIAGVNMWKVREFRLTSEEVLKKVGLKPIEVYVYRRQLRWVGHVSRMPWHRLPRKFMSAWCGVARPESGPEYRWGDGVERALSAVKLGVKNWHKVAKDREEWRKLVMGYGEDKKKKKKDEYEKGYRTGGAARRARAARAATAAMGVIHRTGPVPQDVGEGPDDPGLLLIAGVSMDNQPSSILAQYAVQKRAWDAYHNITQQVQAPAATAAPADNGNGTRSVFGPAGFSTLPPLPPTT